MIEHLDNYSLRVFYAMIILSGDFFENDLPDADLYILGKVVHDWNTEQSTTLLQKVYGKLKSGEKYTFIYL